MNIQKYKHLIFQVLISFTILFVFSLIAAPDEFYYDSRSYWNLGQSFVSDGHFSLYGLPSYTIRGYLFLLMLCAFSRVGEMFFGDPLTGFVFCNSMLHAVLCGAVLPSFFSKKISPARSYIAAAVISLLTILFFRSTLMYPLSDGPAVLFACGSVLALKAGNRLVCKDAPSWIKRISCYFLCGVLSYAAYNTRTIYIFVMAFNVALILVVPFLNQVFTKALKKSAAGILALLLGMLIIATPQAMINKELKDDFTFAVITKSLFVKQLRWGLNVNRYETYASRDRETYESAGIKFFDGSGQKLIDSYAETIQDITKGSYLKILAENPVSMLAIYTRHLVNLLTPLYPEVYIKDLSVSRLPLFLANFAVWAMAILALIQKVSAREKDGGRIKIKNFMLESDLFYCLILLIPCAAIIPGAPETRFFLPVHMFTYAFLAFVADFPAMLHLFKKHAISFSLFAAVLFAIWACIISSTLAVTQRGVTFLL